MTVSATKRLLVTLSDGRLIDAGMVPTAAGVPGERGAPGEKGEKGEKGDAGTSLVEFTMQNGNLIAAMSNGESKNLGSVVGPQGAQGAQGPQGPIGQDGYTFSYVEDATNAYLSGRPGTTVRIVIMTPTGEEDGGSFDIPPAGFLKIRKLNVTGKTAVLIRQNGSTMGVAVAGG